MFNVQHRVRQYLQQGKRGKSPGCPRAQWSLQYVVFKVTITNNGEVKSKLTLFRDRY